MHNLNIKKFAIFTTLLIFCLCMTSWSNSNLSFLQSPTSYSLNLFVRAQDLDDENSLSSDHDNQTSDELDVEFEDVDNDEYVEFLKSTPQKKSTRYGKNESEQIEVLVSDYVANLTHATFPDFVARSESPDISAAVVFIYSLSCEKCYKVFEDFVTAAYEMSRFTVDMKAIFGMIDITLNQEFINKYNVDGIPSLFIFRNGNIHEHVDAKSEFKKESIIQIASHFGLGNVHYVNYPDPQTWAHSRNFTEPVTFVVANVYKGSKKEKMILDIAKEYENDFNILFIISHESVVEDGPFVYISWFEPLFEISHYDKVSTTYGYTSGLWSKKYMKEFIERFRVPMMSSILNPNNLRNRKYMAVIMGNGKKEIAPLALAVADTAMEHHPVDDTTQMAYLVIDIINRSEILQTFGIQNASQGVMIVGITDEGNDKYMKKYFLPGPFKSSDYAKFEKDVIEGKAKNFLKSSQHVQEIKDDIFYTTVVAKTFKDIVLDENTWSLVIYYSESNENSPKIKVVANRLGEYIYDSEELRGIVQICLYDLDANESIDVRVLKPPAIYIYPLGPDSLSNAYNYQGNSDAQSIKQFIEFKFYDFDDEEEL